MMMIDDPWEEEHVLQDFASSKQWGGVKHNETYFNLADPFRILTLKDSPGRDDTLKLSQVHRASRPVWNDSPIFCFFAKESPGWEMQAAPILSPVPTFVRQLLYTKRIYRSKEKILHDFIVWYCMPILCPFLVAVTHLAKQNLEQLASGGPSRTGSIIHPCSGTHEWRAGLLRQHFAAIQRSLHLWLKHVERQSISHDDDRWSMRGGACFARLCIFKAVGGWNIMKHTLTWQIHFES